MARGGVGGYHGTMHGRAPGVVEVTPRPSLRTLLVCGVVCTVLAGCQDSPTDPLAALATVETVPSLALSAHLPGVADVVARLPLDEELRLAGAAWEASWDREDGEEIRARVRARVAPVIHEQLGAGTVRTALESLAWLRETPELTQGLPRELATPVEEALVLLEQAETSLALGEGAKAAEQVLAASDRVRSVTPEAVARRLVTRAARLLASREWEAAAHERAQHLLNGARRALDDGDAPRALQRAFYAGQVLEGALVPDVPAPGGEIRTGG